MSRKKQRSVEEEINSGVIMVTSAMFMHLKQDAMHRLLTEALEKSCTVIHVVNPSHVHVADLGQWLFVFLPYQYPVEWLDFLRTNRARYVMLQPTDAYATHSEMDEEMMARTVDEVKRTLRDLFSA